MPAPLSLPEAYGTEIEAHRDWLRTFPSHAKAWESRLNSDPEPAIVEACTRMFLSGHVAQIEPNEDVSKGGPDFRCRGDGAEFLVEATCLTIEVVTRATSLPPFPSGRSEARWYRDLTKSFANVASSKAKQAGGQSLPTLVAIGTLHFQASGLCFSRINIQFALTSKTAITGYFDPTGADHPVFETTDLQFSTVMCPVERNDQQTRFARQSISGFLFMGLGGKPWSVLGAMHPGAVRPFPRSALSRIPFCQVRIDDEKGTLRTEWT